MCLHFHHTFFERENHLLMCWDQEIPIQQFEPWFLASSSCFPLQSFSYPSQIYEREIECWGDYHLKHKSKEFIINTPPITFWRVMSPRLVRCHLGASKIMWSWTKEFVRARRSPTSWRSTPSEASLHGRKPWWNRQGCFFVDPLWVEPSVDSRSRYPSWVEVSINVDVR
jgi:hypothetical protein